MEAILKFDLPEEKDEFKLAAAASDFWCVLWDVDQRCRGILKYEEPSEETEKFAEEIRNIIRDRVDMDLIS